MQDGTLRKQSYGQPHAHLDLHVTFSLRTWQSGGMYSGIATLSNGLEARSLQDAGIHEFFMCQLAVSMVFQLLWCVASPTALESSLQCTRLVKRWVVAKPRCGDEVWLLAA